ncbi:MAG TPA: Holliday junction branch migration DNA helicase RuvB, partial [Gammaproteobacteria bacterium]|nr:Holliday junction branch migration DNA helicase RuvB [Gammaproteobacteria bacterium]
MPIERDRLVTPAAQGGDETVDRALRPRQLADYVGQAPVRSQMEIFIAAARA